MINLAVSLSIPSLSRKKVLLGAGGGMEKRSHAP
ncbi:hypothetical protein PHAMO_270206 [Magnetospirillum molischianum DSM 120]|uniref:Uncharacterized protein n=1 Tax=Magnetospirillum molischianum DSM 120 TaxID=1150626 RepID=H8FSM7_MAGML|nr:hypothetical protein PHAMO_270206 [Magnetospirillum molischianum DSM 120]